VTKPDYHVVNVVSIVIGVLVAVAVLLFALARHIGGAFEAREVMAEEAGDVERRIAPVGRVAIAGRDNSALAIAAAARAPAPAALPANGEEVFKTVCGTCHGPGLAGAPKFGDHAAWAARLAEGRPTLYQHALAGYQGKAGVMPAKGGRPDLSDDLIRQAVDYMVKGAQ